MAKRRRATSRTRTTRTSAPAKKPALPPLPPGRVWLLNVPWEERAYAQAGGAFYRADLKWVWVGDTLPDMLHPYAARKYTWQEYRQRQVNAARTNSPFTAPPANPPTITLRDHQRTAVSAITTAMRAGARGFYLGDGTGLGKTFSACASARSAATNPATLPRRKVRNVLIICPKPAIPHWRSSLDLIGGLGANTVIVNHDGMKPLLDVPDLTVTANGTARKRAPSIKEKNRAAANRGKSLIPWDVVIIDEAHAFRHDSQRTRILKTLADYDAKYDTAPFTLWLTATAGHSPLELRYLSPLFAQLAKRAADTTKNWGAWLSTVGFHVEKRGDEWKWTIDPDEQKLDTGKVYRILFGKRSVPVALRRTPVDTGHHEPDRQIMPVELDPTQTRQYGLAWAAFRTEIRNARRASDKSKQALQGRVARLRFRQKASLLRATGTADFVEMLVGRGIKPVVSCEFLESVDTIVNELKKRKITAVTCDGRDPENREKARLAFQRGQADAIVFTVTEAISLHAGELLPDGTHAVRNPRVTVVHDPRYSAIQADQIEGRAHRDGMSAPVVMMYAEGTVEALIVKTQLRNSEHMKDMVGDDTTAVKELENQLDTAALEGTDNPDSPNSLSGVDLASLRLRNTVKTS